MRLTSLVCGLSLLSQSVFAYHIPSLDEAAEALEKRATIVATTGVPGAIYPRLEVRQMLFNKPNQWTLFILAMQSFQAQQQSSATSYYQIAGIHGVPHVNYNGVGQCSTCSDADGYCTHDSVLFPAWHRAYLALFEQQFITVVNQVAASFPASQQAAMKGAASTMRFPYWDWAAQPTPGGTTLPVVVSERTISVNTPTGQQTINNPLFRHYFSDASQLYYSPFVDWPYTLRYPNSDASTASSVEQSAISAFDNIRPSMQDQVYQLFSTCSDYLHFSNDDAGSSSTSCSNSLEGIHNTIHTTAGGPGSSTVSGGHMTYLPLAAFDPICTTQTADSPLTPFYKDTAGSTFWTTNMVQHWNTTFHYTYPEFSDSDGSQGAIASYINKLYGPSATATAGSSKRTADPEPLAAAEAVPTAAPEATLVERQGSPLKAANGSLFQYVANIKTPRYALNGSYYVFLFNGAPSSEVPTSWIQDPNLIGPMGVLSQSNMTGMDLVAAGSVPLTRTLTNAVKGGLLLDITELLAVPYLQTTLAWRVSGPNGTSIDPGTIPDFEISVFASTAAPPATQYSLPEWSEFIPLVEVTQYKSGGANDTAGTTTT
ncbi:hypothetical protein LTR08_007101 [Meristemomyces frigidus]|nr:hypothetical protein LTR08_007101 [Meristemomyces frigidus]